MPREQKKPESAKSSLNLVGPRVRRLRLAMSWSQADLAAACQRDGWDIGRDIVNRIEAGIRQVIDYEIVVLSRVFCVTTSELLGVEKLPAQKDALITLLASRRPQPASVVSEFFPRR